MAVIEYLKHQLVHTPLEKDERALSEEALTTLRKYLGHVPFPTSPCIADRIEIPGDPDTWVVFGTYLDGTVDVVREQALCTSGTRDLLRGYTLGTSLQHYYRELQDEFPCTLPPKTSPT